MSLRSLRSHLSSALCEGATSPARALPRRAARRLAAGGLTHVHHAEEHPDKLRLVEYYGAVDTTWVVYGSFKRFAGEAIGQHAPAVHDRSGLRDTERVRAVLHVTSVNPKTYGSPGAGPFRVGVVVV
jgi:hypothetical protein